MRLLFLLVFLFIFSSFSVDAINLTDIKKLSLLKSQNVASLSNTSNGTSVLIGPNKSKAWVYNKGTATAPDLVVGFFPSSYALNTAFSSFKLKGFNGFTTSKNIFLLTDKAKKLTISRLPRSFQATFNAYNSALKEIELKPGVNYFSLLNFSRTSFYTTLRTEKSSLPVSGTLPAAFLNHFLTKKISTIDKTAIETINLKASLKYLRPVGLPTVFKFGKSTFLLNGLKNKSGQNFVKVSLKTTYNLTLNKKTLTYTGDVYIANPLKSGSPILLNAKAAGTWVNPLGVKLGLISSDHFELEDFTMHLDLNRIRALGTNPLEFVIKSSMKPNKNVHKVELPVRFERGMFKKMRFLIPEGIDVSSFPGFVGAIPGVEKFLFTDVEISNQAIAGTFAWNILKIPSRAVIYFDPKDSANLTLFYRVKDLKASKLIPIKLLPNEAVRKIAQTIFDLFIFPEMIVTLSIKGFNYQVSYLPESVQDILKGIAGDPNYVLKVEKNLSLVTSWDPTTARGLLGKIIKTLGLTRPLMLIGTIEGLFGGKLGVKFEAILPALPVTDFIPKEWRFVGDTTLAYFTRLNALGDLDLGYRGSVDIRASGINQPPVRFSTEVTSFLGLLSPAGGFAVTLRREGNWLNPFGLYGLVMKDSFVKFTMESDTTFGFVMSSEATVSGDRYKLDALGSFNAATCGMPKEFIINLETSELGLRSYMGVADVALKSITESPITRKLVVGNLPKKEQMNANRILDLFRGRRDEHLYDRFQMHRFPAASLKDTQLYLCTPGASDPDLKLEGAGVAVKGALWFLGKELGKVHGACTLRGLKIMGSVTLPPFGPIHLEESMLDISANLNEAPHFVCRGKMKLFGYEGARELQFSKDKVCLYWEDSLDQLWHYKFLATSQGKDLLRVKDFTVDSELSSDFNKYLDKKVRADFNKFYKGLDRDFSKIEKDVKEKKARVEKLDKDLNDMRARVRSEQKKILEPLKKAEAEVDRLKKKMASIKNRKIKKDFWYLKNKTKQGIELAAVAVAYGTAKGVLYSVRKAIETGNKIIPIDLDPRVAAIKTAKNIALAALVAVEVTVKAGKKINSEINEIYNKFMDALSKVDIVAIEKANFTGGSLVKLLKNQPADLDIRLRVFGKYKLTIQEKLYVIDPKIEELADRIVKKIINIFEEKEKEYSEEMMKAEVNAIIKPLPECKKQIESAFNSALGKLKHADYNAGHRERCLYWLNATENILRTMASAYARGALGRLEYEFATIKDPKDQDRTERTFNRCMDKVNSILHIIDRCLGGNMKHAKYNAGNNKNNTKHWVKEITNLIKKAQGEMKTFPLELKISRHADYIKRQQADLIKYKKYCVDIQKIIKEFDAHLKKMKPGEIKVRVNYEWLSRLLAQAEVLSRRFPPKLRKTDRDIKAAVELLDSRQIQFYEKTRGASSIGKIKNIKIKSRKTKKGIKKGKRGWFR
ncbi:hypothetical protein ACFL35_19670 [Candidatus Riflebacteria bacterium]